jgi:hypothetical protein
MDPRERYALLVAVADRWDGSPWRERLVRRASATASVGDAMAMLVELESNGARTARRAAGRAAAVEASTADGGWSRGPLLTVTALLLCTITASALVRSWFVRPDASVDPA